MKDIDYDDPTQRTRRAVKDIKSRKLYYFYINCSNGYDCIRIDKKSVKVIDAKKGLIQMRVISIDGI